MRLQRSLGEGLSFYESLRQSDLLSSLDLQMVKVGTHSGKTDQVFRELAAGYETEADEVLEGIISRFEPTMVVVLALVVGLILLAVMMPLVGIMAAIG
jgi:type IV pilus assembly protein PilC